VKYALLCYNAKDAWDGVPENEQKAIYGEYAALTEAPGIFGAPRCSRSSWRPRSASRMARRS
jgi:hypothetical protein